MMRRRRVARPRRKTAWYSGAQSECGTRLTVTPCNQEEPPPQDVPPDLFLILDNPEDEIPGQIESVGEVTLLRLVGDLAFWSSISAAAATEPQLVTFSFYVGFYIADSPANQFTTTLDPSSSPHATSKDWLWRSLVVHTYAAGLGATVQSQVQYASSGPTDPHIDVRVKRKLRKSESIIMSVKVLTDNPFPAGIPRTLNTAFLYTQIRALCALP